MTLLWFVDLCWKRMMCEGALAERRRAWFLSDMLAALLAAETGLIVALQMILNCVQ